MPPAKTCDTSLNDTIQTRHCPLPCVVTEHSFASGVAQTLPLIRTGENAQDCPRVVVGGIRHQEMGFILGINTASSDGTRQ